MKVAAMRVERGIQQKYRVHVLEHSNLSKTWFVLTIWVFRFTLLSGYLMRVGSLGLIRRQISPQGLAVLGRAVHELSFRKGASLRHHKAIPYLASVEHCCFRVGGREETTRRLNILAQVLSAFGKNSLVVHELHCVRVRQAWKDTTARIGNPFSSFGNNYRPFLRMPNTFSRNVYTLEQLLELARLIKAKEVDWKFVIEAVTQYGMFLPPDRYRFLFELTLDPTLHEYGLAGIAWLYHSNVPLEAIPLCASLLPYIDFPQARSLAEEGVLPELLAELKTAELLPLSNQEIVYIHRQCEEGGLERILEMLKAGIAPHHLKTALLLGEEFPERRVKRNTHIVSTNHVFDRFECSRTWTRYFC